MGKIKITSKTVPVAVHISPGGEPIPGNSYSFAAEIIYTDVKNIGVNIDPWYQVAPNGWIPGFKDAWAKVMDTGSPPPEKNPANASGSGKIKILQDSVIVYKNQSISSAQDGTVDKDSIHEFSEIGKGVGLNDIIKGPWYKIGKDRWVAGQGASAAILYNPAAASNTNNTTPAVTTTPVSQTPGTLDPAITEEQRRIIEENAAAEKQKLDNLAKADSETLGEILKQTIAREADARVERRDSYTPSTRLFGIPFQFTEKTDLRTSKKYNMGRKFMEAIVAEAPIVTIIPGKPKYLPDSSEKEKGSLSEIFASMGAGDKDLRETVEKIMGDESREIRYFTFQWDYYTYMRYVNLLCSATAVLMGLDSLGFPSGNGETPYWKYDWSNYKFSSTYQYKRKQEAGQKRSVFDLIVGAAGAVIDQAVEFASEVTGAIPNYVQFYMEPTNFSESIGNAAGPSKIQGFFDTSEGLVKELAFLAGTGGADDYVSNVRDTAKRSIDQLKATLGAKDGMINRLLSSGNNVLQGNNIMFPEIWTSASYGTSYSITIDLVSPYGDKESVYLNVIVPMMHLVALALPKNTSANSYAAPFIVKAFAKGMFNCEMGVIESLSIEKGGGGEAWTVDGFPSQVKVTLSIKDLYSHLSMNTETELMNFFQNQSLMEYLANMCGIDLVKPELRLKVDMIKSLVYRYVTNIPRRAYEDVVTSVKASFTDAIRGIMSFGRGG
jgi:hypothetical protein